MKKELGIFVLLIVLCIIVAAVNPNFPSADQPAKPRQADWGVRHFQHRPGNRNHHGRIELSVGSMMALLGVLLSMMLTEWHFGVIPAVLLSIIIAMCLGLIHGLLIRLNMQPFIVTLCGLTFLSRTRTFS
jgi:ribose transport system permease protein